MQLEEQEILELLDRLRENQATIEQLMVFIKEDIKKFSEEKKSDEIPEKKEHALITELKLNSISGRSLKVCLPEPGKIYSYPKDVTAPAFVFAEDGKTIEKIVKGNRVFPPEFTLIGKGATDKEQIQSIIQQVDSLFIELLKQALCPENIIPFDNFYGKDLLEEIQQQVEQYGYLVDKFIVNRSARGAIKRNIDAIDFDSGPPKDLWDVSSLSEHKSIWAVDILEYDSAYEEKEIIFAVAAAPYEGRITIRFIETDATGQLKLIGSMCLLNSKMAACGAQRSLLNISFK